MANKDKTEIIVVLDRSGSMQSIAADMNGGFSTFIEEQKKVAGGCLVSLYQFDDKYEVVYEGKAVAETPPLSLVPRGSTALLDAVGKSIANTIGRHDAMAEVDKPAAVVFLIITDGGENASREWNLPKVQAALKDAEDNRKWQMVFMAADATAFAQGGDMGFKRGKLGSVDKSSRGIRDMYSQTSEAVRSYRVSTSKEQDVELSVNINNSKEEGPNNV